MTIHTDIWAPDLSRFEGPKYRAIADAVSADIRDGVLKPGDRLPPQRELAWQLKVTVGTVTRAYQEAERRGLVGGEVGRGTFVRPMRDHSLGSKSTSMPTDWYSLDAPDEEDDPDAPINMQFNFPPGDVGTEDLRRAMMTLSQDPRLGQLLWYQAPTGNPLHLQAAETWMAKRGLSAPPDTVVISSGAHNGILATLAAICRSGGRVATERLVYPGLRAIARLLGLELVPIDIDGEGIMPDALRQVLATGGIDAVYTVPTLQNPTNVTQSEERRDALAAIFREFDVPVVEDDLFGLLPEDAPTPLTARLPDIGYYVTSLSKSVAPGLRVGFIRGPARSRDQIAAGVRGSTWMASPLTTEIASRWILDGTGERILMERRRIDEMRREKAQMILEGLDFDMPPGSLHAWLHLPDPWHASQFVNHAREEGVILSAAHAFSIGRERPPFAVRVCLGPPRTEERMVQGLHSLRHILDKHDPMQDQAAM
ncbi:MAG: PLP-dependent aminotransferase family protein [Alphaproteobacteria bacterium]